ncbi:histone-lysine N-methyltransferase, H3 lysine-9 specific SUVH4-like isoform X2 [Camellia sinensis]|uniref:histone-lysine N-methyltransferase, H3 lysine-9 specific SUVH4-like isoform X2 n=1 Tax=Camellia sinensis TaxID=4442 RepID=UPI001036912E|nr:histone-lysine N-methyltransferase, H3 lysine-9 specific SUVH4-like isoform X2 [Camellia sinensis]
MVVQSFQCGFENGITSPSTDNNGVSVSADLMVSRVSEEGDMISIKCEEVSVNNSPALKRRASARIQKIKTEKALLRLRDEQESLKHVEEKVSRKKTRVYERKKVSVSPLLVLDDNHHASSEANKVKPEIKYYSANAEGSRGAAFTEVAETQTQTETGTGTGIGVGVEKSAYALVTETLRTFNKHYLHFIQLLEEEKRCRRAEADRKTTKGSNSKKGNAPKDDMKRGSKRPDLKAITKKGNVPEDDTKLGSKRPDLKAITKMMETNTVLYPSKRFGSIPGIDVGHQFFSRAEMVVVGFHNHWLNGIDCIGKSASKDYSGYTLPLAVSIVLSGQYEDDLDNCEDIVYTGQGGNNLLGNRRQIQDQVMERGNLGLKNCMEQGVPVRVVRGHQSANSYVGKVYTYDGLYKVVNYWAEKGVSGFTVYKFRLKRLEGQPLLTTNQVQYFRGRAPNSISEIRGLVCEDITRGQEDIPIPATNLVDDPPLAPTGFTYCKSIQVAESVKLPKNTTGCDCKGNCINPKSCACARLNGSDFPYVHRNGGRLIEPKAVLFECGPYCGCGPDCVNRTSQRGLRYRLEVFRTPKKGWGVRSWDYIPSGAPVCEYTGILMKTEEIDTAHENNYIFDIDCLQTMKGLDGRERRLRDVSIPTYLDRSDDHKSDSVPEYCIDAGSTGNIARFINHSCQPNLFVQCVLSSHHDIKLARVVLFAADNIPPLKELTYDYGYAVDSVMGADGKIRQMACYCGAADCRKRLL